MIEARGLTKRFGNVTAVDSVDLVVHEHGIVGFLGPNGAGKTTTMRMLTGYLPMNEGTALVAGHDVFEDPIAVKASVGYLPETPPLYPELTVGEYLNFVAEIRGVPSSDRLRRVGETMERVGLRHMEQRLTGALSKGYRQRVGLAQALVHEPPVVILDEPTSGLDPAQVIGVRRLIKALSVDRVVVVSTHILQEVELLCDRVVVINNGRIAGDGTVESLAASVGAGSWLEVGLTGAGDDVLGRLSGLSEAESVQELEPSGPIRRFRLSGSAQLGAQISGLAATAGWTLHLLAPHRARLEEVFLQLVEAEA